MVDELRVGFDEIRFSFDKLFERDVDLSLVPSHPSAAAACDVAPRQAPRPTVIVSGIGRSGTGYVAEVLRESGLKATHKQVFFSGIEAPCRRCLQRSEVEVSGFAMPYLHERIARYQPVVLVVRDPMKWLGSWHTKRYGREYLANVLGWRAPGPADSLDLTAAIRTWFEWNMHVARRAAFFFRVEDMTIADVQAIARYVGRECKLRDVREALDFTPHNFNTTGQPAPTVRWDDIPHSVWKRRAYALSLYFGYPRLGEQRECR